MSDVNLRILLSASSGNTLGIIADVAKSLGGGGLSGILATVGLAAGAAAIGVGVLSVKMASDFQESMLSLVAHAGLAQSQFDNVSQSVLQMSTIVGRSPTELAQALYPILSAFSGITDQSAKSALALTTLKLSMETVAGTTVDGTAVANAAVGTFNALGLATNNAAVNAQRMTSLMDIMDKTVQLGNMQWDQYKNVISKLAVSIQGTSIKFNEASAALATLTNEGYSAQRAQTYLSNLFTDIAIKTDALAKHAKKLGIAFDEQKYSAMTLAQKIAYLNDITHGNKQELLALLGNNATALKAFNALSVGTDTYKNSLDALNHSQGALASSFDTASQGFGFAMQRLGAGVQALLITIGLQLLPVLTGIVNAIVPVVNNIITWIGQGDNLKIVLAGVAAIIVALVLPAVWSLAAGVIAATWPFVLIGVAVAGVVALFKHWYDTNAGFRSFIDNLVSALKQLWTTITTNIVPALHNLGDWFQAHILPILKDVGTMILTQLQPAWQQIADVWNSQIMPALKQLWTALQPLMPTLKMLGEIIGGVVIVQFLMFLGIVVGVITGVAKAIGTFVGGLAQFIGGIVQVFSGFIQMFSGLWRFIIDLVTGNFSKLKGDFMTFAGGVISVFTGLWNMAQGIWQMAIGTITSLVGGFIGGIVGFFKSLFHQLVGGSIVPDMINSIITWFKSLPQKALDAIGNLKDKLVSFFSDLATKALDWGKSILTNLANGIINNIANTIGNAMKQVGDFISSHLPHSPAKMGPLMQLAQQGQNITAQIAQGITAGTPKLQAALNTSLRLSPAAVMPSAGGGAGGTSAVYHHYWQPNITIQTNFAPTSQQAQAAVDMIEQELSRRMLAQTPGYNTAGVF